MTVKNYRAVAATNNRAPLYPSLNWNWNYHPETLWNLGEIGDFLACVTLKLNGWPWKTIEHLFYAPSSFVHHFIPIFWFKLELSSGLKHSNLSKICFDPMTLTFDLWHWPFAWTSLLSKVITPRKLHDHKMGGTLWKGVTDRQMDRTVPHSCLVAAKNMSLLQQGWRSDQVTILHAKLWPTWIRIKFTANKYFHKMSIMSSQTVCEMVSRCNVQLEKTYCYTLTAQVSGYQMMGPVWHMM